jgi:putative AdoMet-dependent methyltransferase
MDHQSRTQLFDRWAEHYEPSIRDKDSFPFDGYARVLDEIVHIAGPQSGMKMLDLGIGTGNLAARFAATDCEIWGIDFSAGMLAKAREQLPEAVLLQADLLGDWPEQLNRRFDRIVSAYVLHEFDLATKVTLLQKLTHSYLALSGLIIIGDIAFPTSEVLDRAQRAWADSWDEDEFYWVADEATNAFKRAGLQMTYRQISSCGGVFVVEPVGVR